MLFAYIKYPWNIKAKEQIAFVPFASGVGDEISLRHAGGVGNMQLKYMATGFDIKANG